MNLGKLIEELRNADPDYIAPIGFAAPRSYRGYYEDVAFKPAENVSVASMLVRNNVEPLKGVVGPNWGAI